MREAEAGVLGGAASEVGCTLAGCQAVAAAAAAVVEVLGPTGSLHFFACLREDRGGGVVIQIDAASLLQVR